MKRPHRRWLLVLFPTLYVCYALRPFPYDVAFLERGRSSNSPPRKPYYPWFAGKRLEYPRERFWWFDDASYLPAQVRTHLTPAHGWEAFETHTTNMGRTALNDTANPSYDVQTVVSYVHHPTGAYLGVNHHLGPNGKVTYSVNLFEPQGIAAILDRVRAVPWRLAHPFNR